MIEFDLPAPLPEPPPAPPPPDADIPPEAFGARQFAALMPEAVDDPLYRREAATANATRVEELNNDFIGHQREILQTGPDAFYNRQGRDAILAAPDTISRLNAAQDEVLSQAETPSQRAMLSKILDNHMLVTHYGIGSHVGRQSMEWQRGVAQARLDQLHTQARLDYGDPDSIANYADAGQAAAQDHTRLSGLPATSDEVQARASDARSAIYRTAIESALEANDNQAASTLHEQAQDDLTPADAAIVEPQMKAAAEIETARDYVGKIVPPPSEPSAYFDASRLMAEADAAHQAATEQNNTDWADNPAQRATNQHHIDVQFGLQKRGIEQAKAQLDSKVTDWLTRPMPDGQPQINRPPIGLWTQLGPDQKQGVDLILAQNARGQVAQRPEPAPARGTAPMPEPLPGSSEYDTANIEARQIAGSEGSNLSTWQMLRAAFERFDLESNKRGAILATDSASRHRQQVEELKRRKAAGEQLNITEERYLQRNRNVASILGSSISKLIDAEKRLDELPRSAPLRKFLEAPTVEQAGRALWENPGEITRSLSIESLPDLLLGIIALGGLGVGGGAAALPLLGGVQGYADGLVGALAKEGVDVSDPHKIAEALQNQELMDRVRSEATTQGAVTAGAILALTFAGTHSVAPKVVKIIQRTSLRVGKNAIPKGEARLASRLGNATQKDAAPRNVNIYEIFLEAPVTGSSRSAHRASANRYLANLLRRNSEFALALKRELGTDVLGYMQVGKTLRNPPGMVWHHSMDNPNVVQLLRVEEHRRHVLQPMLHPNGLGGFRSFYVP